MLMVACVTLCMKVRCDMYDLIQHYLGHTYVVDYALSLTDCLNLRDYNTFMTDGVSRFTCEVLT